MNHNCIHLTINVIIKWYFPPKSYIFLLTMPDLSALHLIKWQSVDRKLNWEAFIDDNLLRRSHTSQYLCHVHKHITSFWVSFPQCTINSKWMVYEKGVRMESLSRKMTWDCRRQQIFKVQLFKTRCFNLHIFSLGRPNVGSSQQLMGIS